VNLDSSFKQTTTLGLTYLHIYLALFGKRCWCMDWKRTDF